MKRLHMILAACLIVALLVVWNLFASPSEENTIASGAPIVQVSVPELDGNAELGRIAFNQSCAVCHGADAAGQDGVAPPLVHKIYEPGHHSDMSFFLAVQNGVRAHHWRFGNMPPIEGVPESDVELIVEYVRTLQRANGIF